MGSSFAEACLSAPLVVLTVTAALALGYGAFAKIWLDHCTYEAAVCLAADRALSSCRDELQMRIERMLPIGRITFERMRKSRSEADVSVKFDLSDRLKWNTRRVLHLPLKRSP